MKTLYVKMTPERRPAYGICTMVGREDGRLVLRKRAMTEAAVAHIRHIEENCRILSQVFGAAHVASCTRVDEATIAPDFIEGRTLTGVLDAAVAAGDEAAFRAGLSFYEASVLVRVAEGPQGDGSALALNVPGRTTNVDLTFDNIVLGDAAGTWHIIDYEWLAKDVSRDFVRMRALRGYLTRSGIDEVRARRWLDQVYPQFEAWFAEERYQRFEQAFLSCVLQQGRRSFEKRIWTLEEQRNQIAARVCASKDREIAAKDAIIEARNRTIYERDRTGEMLTGKIAALRQEEERLSQVVREQQAAIAALQQEEERLSQVVREQQAAIASRTQELLDIRSSHAWRLMLRLWRVRDVLIPMNSRRRLFAKLVYKSVTQPRKMFAKLSWENIRKFHRYLLEESPADVERRLALQVPNPAAVKLQLDLLPQREAEETRGIDSYAPLCFIAPEAPQVSIVIPVYNEFDYTYLCLAAIKKHTRGVSYEVLLADDGSTDATRDVETRVSGIRVIRHESNLRFLKNCNAATKEARGEYVVFLNNDTQVQDNWLAPLVRLMEEDASIGMTGAKLVYPDGRLQEAGGILWQDGSAWNYGHGDDPSFVQYNYVKDVDYISGAAICIRRALWEEIGGFDERFAPAYYEDTDLAFEVRRHGKRVVYQPLSVVVHFEGVSNGTDTSSGQKAYQEVNAKKFFDKWRDVLAREHFPNGEHVTLARDRSRQKKYILVVDHYVPHYDTDAGGRCSFEYLEFFVALGLHVVFVGDNYFAHQPYTQELQQKGIEVLCGDGWTMHRFEKWLQRNGRYLDYVYLQRPHIAVKYIDLVRRETQAKIIYFGHDLHFVRERRQYEIEKDPALLASAEKWEKIEMELFHKADVVHVVGAYEQQFLEKRLPGKPVRNIPLYLYDGEALQRLPENTLAGRRSLIFVGGFNHQPNQDAIFWFMQQVYPRIRQALPDVMFYIIGSHPTEAVKALAADDVHVDVTGFVSDERLAELYQLARVNVIPLRYGAGIKGKVIETMFFGVPAVTTPIGAEGLPGVDGCIEIAPVDDAAGCAERVLALFHDDARWRQESAAERAYIRENFTKERAKQVLCLDIDPKEKV